jgi:hypothetical protein
MCWINCFVVVHACSLTQRTKMHWTCMRQQEKIHTTIVEISLAIWQRNTDLLISRLCSNSIWVQTMKWWSFPTHIQAVVTTYYWEIMNKYSPRWLGPDDFYTQSLFGQKWRQYSGHVTSTSANSVTSHQALARAPVIGCQQSHAVCQGTLRWMDGGYTLCSEQESEWECTTDGQIWRLKKINPMVSEFEQNETQQNRNLTKWSPIWDLKIDSMGSDFEDCFSYWDLNTKTGILGLGKLKNLVTKDTKLKQSP